MSPTEGEGDILFLVRILLAADDTFLFARYLMNWWVDINKICMDVILGHGEELIRFL